MSLNTFLGKLKNNLIIELRQSTDIKVKKQPHLRLLFAVLRELDSNQRPPGYEPGELPTAPSRDISSAKIRYLSNNPNL